MEERNVSLVMILIKHDKGLIHKPGTCSGGHICQRCESIPCGGGHFIHNLAKRKPGM